MHSATLSDSRDDARGASPSQRDTVDRYGRRLRELRKTKGLTQQDMAERAGVVFQTIGKLERGELRLRLDQIEAFAAALGVEPWELLTDRPAPAVVPLRFVAASSFGESSPAWNQPGAASVAAPADLARPEECFAVQVADNSADRLYPPGTTLFVRRLEHIRQPLSVGSKVVIAHCATDLAAGDIFEILIGLLDRSFGGDLIVALRSTNRQVPASVLLRPAPAQSGMAERFTTQPAATDAEISYRADPRDQAEILGVVVMAITPE